MPCKGLYPSVFLTALAACCFLFLLYLGSHKVAFTFVISFRFENGGEFTPELEDGDDPTAYVTNLSYYHLVPFETDILD
ncbi:PX domain-containing protein C6orf145-like [Cricetulus griseus]|uniref:PX domain-containing protein C6orf145-like n=2 Tax=Cricetulus griseus TaxID=10029 RepID=G3GZ15_CRIGR|nr:PX domain-containing protein C6orf145-like [Cricetulus griseus]